MLAWLPLQRDRKHSEVFTFFCLSIFSICFLFSLSFSFSRGQGRVVKLSEMMGPRSEKKKKNYLFVQILGGENS